MVKMIRAAGLLTVIVLWAVLAFGAWFGPDKAVSAAERRPLQQLPELSAHTLLNGNFMEKFETYTLDQFPLRDSFRTVKSLFSYKVLGQLDNNGIYIQDAYAAKLEYPLDRVSVGNALKKFNALYRQYLQGTDCKVYITVIPDKGYYLAEANGYPAMDYEALFSQMTDGMPWAKTVDITGSLDITDYYYTDTHWRQEKLMDTAAVLCRVLGVEGPGEMIPTLVSQQFKGVYYGQAALPLGPEDLYVMESPWLSACRVYNYETGGYTGVYDLSKLSGTDPYDVYLSGAQALLRIENPNARTDRELVVFRDSFGSSLVPLLSRDYRTVILVDTRYISAGLLGEHLTFQNQDVLFAYSTLILNSSSNLK